MSKYKQSNKYSVIIITRIIKRKKKKFILNRIMSKLVSIFFLFLFFVFFYLILLIAEPSSKKKVVVMDFMFVVSIIFLFLQYNDSSLGEGPTEATICVKLRLRKFNMTILRTVTWLCWLLPTPFESRLLTQTTTWQPNHTIST